MQESSSTDTEEDTPDIPDVPDGAVLAAIDLGSNSFHLIIAKVEHDEVRTVETLSEKVQLGAGLHDGVLDEDAMQRGLDCLSRFKQVLDSVAPFRIHAVGTNALRQARNRRDFTRRAEALLSVRVNVIYGPEEARLVYLGVAHTLADDEHSRLVIDIGGGSTEFIVGQRFEPQKMDSLQMGCVSYNREFFKDGKITRNRYRRACEAARLEVSRIRHRYHSGYWQEAVGSSGTLQAIELILLNFGWSEAGITRAGLACLEEALLAFDSIENINIESLSETRRNVILCGVAITAGIFDALDIEMMRCSPGALREGVIYDLLGRLTHEDVRERTINAMMQRYNADADIAATVERRARILYLATRKAWQLQHSDWNLLRWAARSHEIGMAISHKHYNRHGAYLLRNADLPGFSQEEQETLALLVLCHRRKLQAREFETMTEPDMLHLLRCIVLLRLANLFKYVEQLEFLPEFRVTAESRTVILQFPEQWLQQHPLTAYELRNEMSQLQRIGFQLEVN